MISDKFNSIQEKDCIMFIRIPDIKRKVTEILLFVLKLGISTFAYSAVTIHSLPHEAIKPC